VDTTEVSLNSGFGGACTVATSSGVS